jgi:hypothetical protein
MVWQVSLAVVVVAASLVGCGDGSDAVTCGDIVVDWEGGPSTFRSESTAIEAFLDENPDLARVPDVALAGGTITSSGHAVGTYSIERLAGGTWGVSGAEWCTSPGRSAPGSSG